MVKPGLCEKLGFASGEYDTQYGKIVCAWKKEGALFSLKIQIPVNTTATIYLPSSNSKTITESGKPLIKVSGAKFLRMESGHAVLEAGSGNYHFGSMMPSPP